jgi:DNA-binding transcriptional LysR family regulator
MGKTTDTAAAGAKAQKRRNGEITLQRMRVFWAVAHSETMTKASKQLGLAQPSLSQQISSLEAIVGTPLFERRSNHLVLTEAGNFLLRQVGHVLRGMQELEDGLAEFSDGIRVTIRVAGVTSVLRLLLPKAVASIASEGLNAEYDIHECAPPDVLEMLYARRANIGLIASESVAKAGAGFSEVPIMEDPYVLAVPTGLDLSGVSDPRKQLDSAALSVLNRSIHFAFGTKHSQRVQEWYETLLPDNRQVAAARSYEVALGFVRAGLGVCLTPVLPCMTGDSAVEGLRLYRVRLHPRRIVAMLPSQYLRLQPYNQLIDALQSEARRVDLPRLCDTPPLLDRSDADPFQL